MRCSYRPRLVEERLCDQGLDVKTRQGECPLDPGTTLAAVRGHKVQGVRQRRVDSHEGEHKRGLSDVHQREGPGDPSEQ